MAIKATVADADAVPMSVILVAALAIQVVVVAIYVWVNATSAKRLLRRRDRHARHVRQQL